MVKDMHQKKLSDHNTKNRRGTLPIRSCNGSPHLHWLRQTRPAHKSLLVASDPSAMPADAAATAPGGASQPAGPLQHLQLSQRGSGWSPMPRGASQDASSEKHRSRSKHRPVLPVRERPRPKAMSRTKPKPVSDPRADHWRRAEQAFERHVQRLHAHHLAEEARTELVARLELAGFCKWSMPRARDRSPFHCTSATSTVGRDERMRRDVEAQAEAEWEAARSIDNLTFWASS